jgi:hypothetical protein
LENGSIEEKIAPNYLQIFGICCTFAKENNIQALTSTTDAIKNEQIQGCLMNGEWKPLVVRQPFLSL